MSTAASLPTSLQRAIEQRSLLKVIAGLANFDQVSVARVARAAAAGGADLIDVACEALIAALPAATTARARS